jgi:hypothetical protein
LDFPLSRDASPVRGRTYKVVVSRPSGAAVSFAYCDTNPYKYGHISGLGANPPMDTLNSDVALRVYGTTAPIDSNWFSVQIHSFGLNPDTLRAALKWAKDSLGVRWLGDDLGHWDTWAADSATVRRRCSTYTSMGFQVRGYLAYGRNDTSISSYPRSMPTAPNLASYPPRNLWWSAVPEDSNFWYVYCHSIMSQLPAVKYWAVWGEPNASWNWRDPDIAYYQGSGGPNDTINTPRERCSLYVQMCRLAKRCATDTQRIVAGYVWRLRDPGQPGDLSKGVDWLRDMFDLAEKRFGGVESCFDVVSVDPYMHRAESGNDRMWFDESEFQADLDTARAVMRAAGHPDMPLWVTEIGWPRWDKSDTNHRPLTDTLMQADNLCKFYTSARARQADPRGGYDQVNWYELTSYLDPGGDRFGTEGFGLLDTYPQRTLPQFHACGQTETLLTGKRFNGRVTTGDTRDDAVRMYEFEDPAGKRTWVCWKNWGSGNYQPPPSTTVPLPVRNDTVRLDTLAYAGNEQPAQLTTGAGGWLGLEVADRPVFVSETKSAQRPELVADSFDVVPRPLVIDREATFEVVVENRSSIATPGPVNVNFLRDDSVIARGSTQGAIPGGSSAWCVLLGYVIPSSFHSTALYRAEVNPGQQYVESTGTDDNSGYVRTSARWQPTGAIDLAMSPNHKTNEPLVLFKLGSRSLEADTLDSVPCGSGLLIQKYFGLHDSVVHNTDTLGWFPFKSETSWVFLHGPGKYRFFLVVRDSWSTSDTIKDASDSIVVFDTTPAVGSVSINNGARFARVGLCTLKVAVADSGAGLRAMRLGTRLTNLLGNSGCVATDGAWTFSGGGYDSALSMAKLTVGQFGPSTLYQTIPCESIWPHMPDSFQLTSDVLVSLPGADSLVVGSLKFGYRFTHDEPARETLTVIANIPFSGGIACHAGISNLDTGFGIVPPALDTFWQFAGGYVEASVSGAGTSGGQVYFDNIKLQVSGRFPQASWWRPCSTAVPWGLGGDCGWTKLYAAFLDSAGVENSVPLYDSIILDNQSPCVHIGCPTSGAYVNGTVSLSGVAYDQPIPNLDTFFEWRRLQYRQADSTNWLPCDPDSVSYSPAWPGTGFPGDVYLGSWNTTNLAAGTYWLKLSALDSAQNLSDHQIWVVVKNDTTGDSTHAGPGGGGSGMGNGSVYIGSSTGRVLHLSDALDSLGGFTVTDSGSEAYVTAILEVGNDSLLVLDARNKRIHKMHKSGQNRRRLVSNLTLPVALVQDSHSNFWLVDKGIHRVGKFRRDGTLVFTRGGLGADSLHFNSPEAIAVKGSLVYVADTKNDRLAVWDTSGNFKASITGDFTNPTAVMVTDSGTIYLTDGSDGKLKGITPLGGSIVTLSASGGSKLRGLVPSENGHSLFTLAPQPNVVHKLRIQSDDSLPGGVQSAGNQNLPKLLSLSQPFPNPARTRLTVAYALPRQTRVTLKLYDIAGKLVTTLANGDQRPGYYHIAWNRTDSRGRSVPAGVYFCSLAAEGQRFSRKVVLTE